MSNFERLQVYFYRGKLCMWDRKLQKENDKKKKKGTIKKK